MNNLLYPLPDWLKTIEEKQLYYRNIKSSDIKSTNERLRKLDKGKHNKVSIVIPAYNEENAIFKCIYSLSFSEYIDGMEIIVVDNNSADHTRDLVAQLHVVNLHQKIQGCGPARQMGLEAAHGDIVLLGDADCVYSKSWAQDMVSELTRDSVSCVYGDCLFIPSEKYTASKLYIHRLFKKMWIIYRSIKRPFLNAYGMSMAFYRKQGLEVGFIMNSKRGEDGRLCYDLMNYGKVRSMTRKRSRVYTPARALEREGKSYTSLIVGRLLHALKKAREYTRVLPPHDTKTSD